MCAKVNGQIFKYMHLLELRCVTMYRHGYTAKDVHYYLSLWALSEKKLHHPTSVSSSWSSDSQHHYHFIPSIIISSVVSSGMMGNDVVGSILSPEPKTVK